MFSDPAFAEQYIKDNPIDVLFTEIPMLGLTGLRLQVKCEAVQPGVLTVFTTATDTYVGEALKSRAQGYIIKPVTREAIRESLMIRNTVPGSREAFNKRGVIVTV